MKLTLLGTSHGVPSESRYGSCYMLEVKDRVYIFDGGAPVVDLLLRRNKDLTKVKAFFNSHFHGDHISGAINMFSLFEWFFKDTDIDVFIPDEVGKKAIIDYVKAVDCVILPSKRVRLDVYDEGIIFDDGVVCVTAIAVNHYCGDNKKSNAFLIEAEGKSILYTGDMSPQLDDFPAVAYDKFIDIVISECAHQPAEKLLECMAKVNTDTFIISHLWPLSKTEIFENEAHKFNFKLCIAKDDDEFIL